MILLNFLTFLLLLLSLFSYFPFTLTLPHCSLRPDDVVLGAVPEFGDVFDVAVLPDEVDPNAVARRVGTHRVVQVGVRVSDHEVLAQHQRRRRLQLHPRPEVAPACDAAIQCPLSGKCQWCGAVVQCPVRVR